jgi:outer membrane protein TolC
VRYTILLLAALGVPSAARPTSLRAQQPLTLEDALREAHAANAQLPLAAFDTRIGEAQLREARSSRGPRFSIDGDLHGGSPARYAGSDGRLQVLAQQPIYDGGALAAAVGVARAGVGERLARYRIAEKDLDLEVRFGFADLLQLDTVIAMRRLGLARLETYLAAIAARRAAGEGVAADLLKTRVQLGDAEVSLGEAERRRNQTGRAVNDLLGRDPDAPLVLVALPAPVAPPDTVAETWSSAPEVRQAEAEVAVAQSTVALVAAERRPHLAMELNTGTQPAFRTFGTGINNGQGQGVEFLISLSWPLFDLGGYRARREQGRLVTERARQSEVAARRQVRLAWSLARAELAARYREVQARIRTAALAEDSYLTSESLYRGGGATTLDVLEAYATWIAANEAAAEAVFNYRVAEAQLVRWGTP